MLKRRASLILVIISMLFCFASSPLAKANQPPVADAGPDQSIYLGEYTQLQGSATDPEGDPIVSWMWTNESAPLGSLGIELLSDQFAPDPAFGPDLVGDYVFSLVVYDGIDYSAPDTVTIHVLENLPPVAVATADVMSGPAPLLVSFDGTQSFDPEGRELFFDWIFGDASPPSDEISPTHIYEYPGTFLAELTVFDDFGNYDEDAIWITVYEPTPESAIEDLVKDVENMNLQQGIDNSLDTKLTSALDALEALNADQRNDAVNKLNAFINEVEVQRGKKLTNEQADHLIAAAQEVISLIPS